MCEQGSFNPKKQEIEQMYKGDWSRSRMELLAHQEFLEVILGDCTKLLGNWRAHTPYQSDREPDAVLAIGALQDEMRKQLRMVLNLLDEAELPF